MGVEYRALVGSMRTEPHLWMYHKDERLELEARHAVWTGHTCESFWDRWVIHHG